MTSKRTQFPTVAELSSIVANIRPPTSPSVKTKVFVRLRPTTSFHHLVGKDDLAGFTITLEGAIITNHDGESKLTWVYTGPVVLA